VLVLRDGTEQTLTHLATADEAVCVEERISDRLES
jgi:hypothetical protein